MILNLMVKDWLLKMQWKTIDVLLKVFTTLHEMIIDIQKKIESENLRKKEDVLNVQKEDTELLIAKKNLKGILLISLKNFR